LYKIGQVGKRARVTLRTIRYYEELGLIGPTVRTKGGFRLYTEKSIERLRFIQGLRLLDFPLSKIRQAARKKGQYEKMLNEIQSTMELVSGCSGCKTKPSYEACCTCKIISRKGELPLPLRAIL